MMKTASIFPAMARIAGRTKNLVLAGGLSQLREDRNPPALLVGTVCLFAAAIFVIDLSLPLGVAGGVPYVALVMLGWWFHHGRYIMLLAILSSVLTVAGYHFSPPGGIFWIVIANRFLALFGIWATAGLLYKAKHSEQQIFFERQRLEERVAERTEELTRANKVLETQGARLAKLTEDILAAREEAEEANRAKSDFLASMSHELRTPLNAVIGFADVIERELFGPMGNDKYVEYIHDIKVSGEHLLDLISDILDLSKVEAGMLELNESVFEVPEVVDASIHLVKGRAARDGVALDIDLPDKLPPVYADERKVKQILVNLLVNAVKFTPSGGRVSLSASTDAQGNVTFVVADTGVGILPGDIERALQPFGQVTRNSQPQHEGTGLGLPLSKALVEMHGGTLSLASEFGKGTQVTFTLPNRRADGVTALAG